MRGPFPPDYLLEAQPDGTTDVLVTEEIVADFRRNGVNRGIVRAIPLTEDEVLFMAGPYPSTGWWPA